MSQPRRQPTLRKRLLDDAIKRLVKCDKLIAKWRWKADEAEHNLGAAISIVSRMELHKTRTLLRRCADDLERALKGNT